MKKSGKKSTIAYYTPILLPSLLVVGSLLLFVVLIQNSLVNTYANNNEAALEKEAASLNLWKSSYSGIILPGSAEKCKKTQNKQCYKYFPGNGENLWVAGDELPVPKSEFESKYLGKRVDFKGKGKVLKINNKTIPYIAVKSISVSPHDYTAGFGYGGGWVGSGYEQYQDELGISSQSPGIYWSAVQLSATDNNYVDRIARYLDSDMQHCQKKGFSCGIFIGGIPGWAAEDSRKKMNIDCKSAEEDVYALPIDTKQHENFAKFIAEIGERYDGDCTKDAPPAAGMSCGPKAAFIMPFNETDINQSYGCGGVPIYATDKDLNGNTKPDYQDYADLMEVTHNKLKSSGAGVPLATSRYAYVHDRGSLPFIENVMKYQMATYGKTAYDVFDIHYYENDRTRWVSNDPYSNGSIRGKLKHAKDLMARYGGIRPIVITETGMYADRSLDVEQARATARIFAQAYTEGILESLQFYTLIGRGINTFYGLVIEGEKRPAYHTFKIMQKNLKGYRFLTIDKSDLDYLEGYIYISPSQERRLVLWKNRKNGNLPDKTVIRSFNQPRVYKTDTLVGSGNSVLIEDGSPQDKNPTKGKVGIELNGDPVIISFDTKLSPLDDELMTDQ